MILTVTFNPAVDKTAEVEHLQVGGLNRLKNVMMDAGGKGVNVSKTIKALHGESICCGFLAGSSGDYIEQSLKERGIACDFVRVEGTTRTNLKVLDKHMELTELNEAGPLITEEDIANLKDVILSHCDEDTIVVLSGNVSLGVPENIYATLIKEIKTKQARVVFDADGSLFAQGITQRPTIIKPNRFELATYFHEDENMSDSLVIKHAKKFLNEDTKLVVVSMGKEGSIFLTKDVAYRVPALTVEAHSSVGAGDAMVAAITYAIEQKMSLEDVIRLAVAASAGAVMTQGTSPAAYDVVVELMNQVKIEKLEEK